MKIKQMPITPKARGGYKNLISNHQTFTKTVCYGTKHGEERKEKRNKESGWKKRKGEKE